jgi:hypothetical protein
MGLDHGFVGQILDLHVHARTHAQAHHARNCVRPLTRALLQRSTRICRVYQPEVFWCPPYYHNRIMLRRLCFRHRASPKYRCRWPTFPEPSAGHGMPGTRGGIRSTRPATKPLPEYSCTTPHLHGSIVREERERKKKRKRNPTR